MTNPQRYGNLIEEDRNFTTGDEEQLALELNRAFEEVATAINEKISGIFAKEEIVTGSQIFTALTNGSLGGRESRYVARKAFDISSVASGTNTIAHGLTWSDTFFITSLYGAIINRSAEEARPLPNVSATPGDQIGLRVSGDNIEIITTSSNFANYQGFVVIEYIP